MTKILFDIDGVLNPHLMAGMPEGYIAVQEGWVSWRLDLVDHAAWLRNLETLAEILWVSSWAEDSNIVCSYYGTETFYPHIPLARTSAPTWKLASVEAYLADTDEAVIWIDDELETDAETWASTRGKTLLIKTDPSVGWTAEQAATMLDFVQANPS